MKATHSIIKSGITPRKIGVFRALQIGDLLCSIPAMKAIRETYPESEISLIGLPWSKSFVQRFSHIFDRHIVFSGFPGLPEQEAHVDEFPYFVTYMQREKFDLLIQMQGNGSVVNPMMELFNATITAGYYKKGEFRPNKYYMEYPDDVHEIHRHLKLLRHLGIKSSNDSLEFPILSEELNTFETISSQYGLQLGNYIVMHTGARDPMRRWSPEKFAMIADTLRAEGHTIVLTGTPDEAETTQSIKEVMKHEVIDLTGKTTLGTAAVLVDNAKLLISNDTGLSHIAAAVRTASVVIFSPYSEPSRWAPLNSTLHTSISFSQSKNPKNVLYAVKKKLYQNDIVHITSPRRTYDIH